MNEEGGRGSRRGENHGNEPDLLGMKILIRLAFIFELDKNLGLEWPTPGGLHSSVPQRWGLD